MSIVPARTRSFLHESVALTNDPDSSLRVANNKDTTNNLSNKNNEKAEILIIYTGGTIGMRPNEHGVLEPSPGFLTSFLPNLYELNTGAVLFEIVEWEELIDSANFCPALWVKLSKQIEKEYENYSGFVVLTGTDTMGFTASYLSFVFENLAKPIILTGAQIPIGESYTDARRNLTVSLLTASRLDVCEVCIFFNDTLLRGNRSKKVDNWGSDAFDSPNFPPLAVMGQAVSVSSRVRPMPRGRLRASHSYFSTIAVIYLVPGFDDKMLLRMAPENDICGLVLMLYGTGNAPSRKQQFLSTIEELIKRKTEIVIASQCMKGSVNMSTYATGQQLEKLGLINGRDMTVEACVTKLSYLMGKGYRSHQLKKLMETNLRGELSEGQNTVPY